MIIYYNSDRLAVLYTSIQIVSTHQIRIFHYKVPVSEPAIYSDGKCKWERNAEGSKPFPVENFAHHLHSNDQIQKTILPKILLPLTFYHCEYAVSGSVAEMLQIAARIRKYTQIAKTQHTILLNKITKAIFPFPLSVTFVRVQLERVFDHVNK